MISSELKLTASRLAGACTPGAASGIRPVLTWKSTAAAPTPTRDGPAGALPSALVP